MWFEKINPLIYTVLITLAGIYIGIIRLGSIAVHGIAVAFTQPISFGSILDLVGNVVLLIGGIGVCALCVAVGIGVAAIVIDHKLRR